MQWFIRIAALGFVVFLGLGLVGGYWAYSNYTEKRAARLAEMKKNAEDVKVTLIEGWKSVEMAEALEKQGLGSSADFNKAFKTGLPENEPFIKVPKGQNLEGYLFPDTYRFAKTSTPEQVISKILDNFTARVASLGVSADSTGRYVIPGYENLKLNGKTGLTFHEIITLASIIEKESGSTGGAAAAAKERKIVSGIFYNRLSIGQALESDATVNFVSGKDDPAPLNTDLQISSPYNTYRNAGLPPGPICNPSLSSIEAALKPEKTDYYYFLHKQPSGEPVFSRTFNEHVENKFRYLK